MNFSIVDYDIKQINKGELTTFIHVNPAIPLHDCFLLLCYRSLQMFFDY